tara:strand:+ start:341 stop:586 length:246 start_codon:yes stop_codon:yes gene_type:complete
MADKKFEPHMMYGDGEAKKAETNQQHLKLKKMGWGHKKGPFKMKSPLYKKNKAGKEQGADGKACWDGYTYMGTENGKDICK